MNEQTVVVMEKLLVSGSVSLEQTGDPVDLYRGMSVLAADEQQVGLVSAVVVDCRECRIATHILLGSIPPTTVYRLIPVTLIDHIRDETVWLQLTADRIEDLPLHQPE